jgi:hypothetical protein
VPDIFDKIKTSRVKAALKQATCAHVVVRKPFNSKRERGTKFFVERGAKHARVNSSIRASRYARCASSRPERTPAAALRLAMVCAWILPKRAVVGCP